MLYPNAIENNITFTMCLVLSIAYKLGELYSNVPMFEMYFGFHISSVRFTLNSRR